MKRGLFFSVFLGLGLCLGFVLLCLGTPELSASNASPMAARDQSASEPADPAIAAGLMPIRVNLEGQLGGPMRAITVSDTWAFVGAGYHLQIIDLADLNHPRARGNVIPLKDGLFSYYVDDVKVVGQYAYVVNYALRIVDISDVDHPETVGEYYHLGECSAVDVQRPYVYLSCGFEGLVVVDISDPAAPERVGALNVGAYTRDIVVSGGHAYVAAEDGLQIIDVSDPTTPIEAGFYRPPEAVNFTRVSLKGQYAYLVGSNDSDLHILDISNPATPKEVGLCEIEGYAGADVAITNGAAFVTNGYAIHMIDVNQPNTPAEIAIFDLISANKVSVSGTTVYIAGMSGLWVLDVGQVSQPSFVAHHLTPGSASNMAKDGDLLYVADGNGGLRILDVISPANISEVGYLDTPGISQDVVVSGDMAYVADGDEGLRIIDVSTPDAPVEAGVYDAVNRANALAIAGDIIYLAHRQHGLSVIDVSEPMTPTAIGSYSCGYLFDVAAAGDLLLVACGSDGLHLVDASAPHQLDQLSTIPGWASHVVVSGNIAYVTADYWLTAIDISTPLTPTVLGEIYLPGVERIHELTAANDRAYVVTGKNTYPAEGFQGLHVIDVGDPSQMREIGWLDTQIDTFGVTYGNGFAYLGLGFGVAVADVSQVNGLENIGYYDLPVSPQAVAVRDGYAYVADYSSNGFKVVDVSQPGSPNWIGSLNQPIGDSDMVLSGDYAYMAEESEGLRIIDISDPERPVQASLLRKGPYDSRAVVVTGTLAYVGGDEGLFAIDVSNPDRPEQLAHHDKYGRLFSLSLVGNLLYASSDSDFKILDISVPEAPLELGTCAANGRIAISGTHAYLASGWETVSIVDISDPVKPQVVGSHSVPTYAEDVAAYGPYALVVDLNRGLRVIDVSIPSSPKEVGYYDTPGHPQGVAVDADLIYVAEEDGGLVILSLQERDIFFNYLPVVLRLR